MSKYFTDIEGVYGGAISSGIKVRGGLDLGYIYVPSAYSSAGVFTRNAFCASSVTLSKKHIEEATTKVVIFNSGNANACTGAEGVETTNFTAEYAAKILGIKKSEVVVASTGIIGEILKNELIKNGLDQLLADSRQKDAVSVGKALLTTDLVDKHTWEEGKGGVVVSGATKGSGMIAPNMATTLSFLVTNAKLESDDLQAKFARAIDNTFNMLSVDTDTSTNDMAVIISTGQQDIEDIKDFEEVLERACYSLARQIAKDGEGATKLLEVHVSGADTEKRAKEIAMQVVNSPLVKTAVCGGDPNWGRALAAAGRGAGMDLDPKNISLKFGETEVVKNGELIGVPRSILKKEFEGKEVSIYIDLGVGEHRASALGCDLTHGYIDINVAYT